MTDKPIRKVMTTVLTCQKCGHTWIPRIPANQVRCCAKCKSPYWDKE